MFAHGALRDAKTCNKFAHDIESVEDLRLLPHMLSVTESPSTPFNRTASSVTGTMGTATELTTPRLKNYRNAAASDKMPMTLHILALKRIMMNISKIQDDIYQHQTH